MAGPDGVMFRHGVGLLFCCCFALTFFWFLLCPSLFVLELCSNLCGEFQLELLHFTLLGIVAWLLLWSSLIWCLAFSVLSCSFIGSCPCRDRDYHIGSNFWKFYLVKTSFTLDVLFSLVKVFKLFRLEWIVLVFRVWTP
jgi:hypothetical protein